MQALPIIDLLIIHACQAKITLKNLNITRKGNISKLYETCKRLGPTNLVVAGFQDFPVRHVYVCMCRDLKGRFLHNTAIQKTWDDVT